MPPQAQPSLKDLMAKAVADARRLANAQIALAKTELAESGQRIGKGGALGIATLAAMIFAVLFLLVTLALVIIALGLPPWAGFLIVAGLLILVAVITGLAARHEFGALQGPNRSAIEFEKTKAALTGTAVTGGASPGAPSLGTPKASGP